MLADAREMREGRSSQGLGMVRTGRGAVLCIQLVSCICFSSSFLKQYIYPYSAGWLCSTFPFRATYSSVQGQSSAVDTPPLLMEEGIFSPFPSPLPIVVLKEVPHPV